ncbi:Ca2+-binding RTX toxin-like protein [Pseudomonas sp. TE3786]
MLKQWMASILFLWSASTWAEDNLCAVVLIEIAQELTLERQAFEATMRINNGLDTIALDQLQVQVLFEDDTGHVVKASSDANAKDAAFFIRLDDSNNLNSIQSGADGAVTNGQVPPKAAGVLRWLIIPTAGAAGQSLAGKRYNVGASLSYNAGGKVESLTVTPDTITVKPQPELTLDYFLTKEVIADDAFTPTIEAPEPYTLGVRVRNSGRGEAKSVKIESAQPKIIGNEQGLAINFRINQSFVDEAAASPTLLIDFGTVAPGKNRNGRWIMESTLSGQFIDFTASFSHPDELGGRLTSLLDAVNTHFLLRDVLVDLPTRDRVGDFLGYVGDELFVFESDSVGQTDNAPCLDCAPVARLSGVLGGSSTLRTLAVNNAQPGFGYVRVTDPYAGTKGLMRVVRANGTALSPHNAWLSKERAEDKHAFNYYLNVFDNNPSGQYTVEFGELTQDPKPPVFMPIADRSTYEGGQVGFLVRASDPNGTVPKLLAASLPSGATFKEDGGGSGTFYWTPLQGQAGRYVVNFRATDGVLDNVLPVGIRVFRAGDNDGDGMDDAWEQQQFGNLDRDGTGDFDGDGISDVDEFDQGSDPKTVELTPLPPQLDTPADNAEVTARYPTLRVQNSANGQGKRFKYWFELYEDEHFASLVAKSAELEEGSGHTQWAVTAEDLIGNATLQDNHRYYWRARVTHTSGSSEWVNGRFFINETNDAPSAPTLLNPTPMGLVAQLRPTFQFNNSFDLDEDALSYRVRVFREDDSEFTQPVVEVTGLLPGANGVTEWQSPIELQENNFYLWLVEAVDEHGAVQQSEPSVFGVSLSNEAPSEPVLAWPLQGQQIDKAANVVLRVDAARDPERQPLQYRIQLDTNERFDSGAVLDSDWFAAAQGTVQWTVPQTLSENRHYFWRVRASDGEQESAWVTGSYKVNQHPEAPATPTISNPTSGAWVEVRNPRLEVHPAVDPDGDALSYEFSLHTPSGAEPLATQVVSELGWTPSFPLQDNSSYRWRVRTVDPTGLTSPWSDWQTFFVNENGVDDAPGLSFVLPNTDQTLTGGSVSIQWTDQDPDSAATIDLYANGQVIASGLAEDPDGDADQFVWSLAGMQPGTYRISAVIRDASSSVTVEASSVTLLAPTPRVQVTPVGSLQLDEFGEAQAEIAVSLDRSPKPGQSVMLNLALSDESEARLLNAQPYLYFTAENWQQPQRIRVTGVDDCSIDGPQTVALQLLPLQSSDSDFAGLDPQDVVLTTADNEQAGQTLFICHYQVVARSEPDDEGRVDITVRPLLLNAGPTLTSAQATPTVQGSGVSLSGTTQLGFSGVISGVRNPSSDAFVLRQLASEAVLFNRVHWAVTGGAPIPVTLGTAGADTLSGNGKDITLDGQGGDDTIHGSSGNEVIIGGPGMDTLYGNAGDDTFIVLGNDSSPDIFNGGDGYDRVLGGEGDDVVRVSGYNGASRVELIDGGPGLNRIEGTAGNDSMDFRVTELRNIEAIDGLAGNDYIIGSTGSDVIIGGLGNDELVGDLGDDTFLVTGAQGFDKTSGGQGYDRLLGSAGDDRIGFTYYGYDTAVELIDGGDGVNVIAGDDTANNLDFTNTLLQNIARIDGQGGNDTIRGSAGNDVINGGPGIDTLFGGPGDDVFLFSGDSGETDDIWGESGVDTIRGGPGDDVLRLSVFSAVYGIEVIDGDGGFNRIVGTTANTLDFSTVRLIGIAQINAGPASSRLIGSVDADVLIGEAGNDVLIGKGGGDTYRFAEGDGSDTIADGGNLADIDRLTFDTQWTPDKLWLVKSGNDLRLVKGTDQVTITGWYNTPTNVIERIELLSGLVLTADRVEALRVVMAGMSSTTADRTAAQQQQLAAAIATAWK